MKEIERKFLVNQEKWSKISKPKPILIKQGYISKSDLGVVRIRVKGEKAFLTIKSSNFGIERYEFEYEIPVLEAEKMFELFCEKCIEKYRYEFLYAGKVWEVDEFIQPKQSFILAEIELSSKDEIFSKPEWLENEVSNEKMYFNSNLL